MLCCDSKHLPQPKLGPSRVRILIPLMEFSSVAYPASSAPFALVWLSSASDPCSYLFSHLCLPLCDSFPVVLNVDYDHEGGGRQSHKELIWCPNSIHPGSHADLTQKKISPSSVLQNRSTEAISSTS